MQPTVRITAAALLLPLLASPALAEVDFTAWDSNGDSYLSAMEWQSGFEKNELYIRLDENDDIIISGEEVDEAGNLDYDLSWDADADGVVDRQEAILGLYSTYDWDLDDRLEEADFQIFLGDVSLEVDGIS